MKTYIYFFAALVFAFAGFKIASCGKDKKPVIQELSFKDSTRHYRDLWKIAHAQVMLEIETRQQADKQHLQKEDSLCRQLKIRKKEIVYVQGETVQVQGKVKTVLLHDTLNRAVFSYDDSTINIFGEATDTTLSLQYQVFLNLQTAVYWKRRWFLGKKIYYIDAFSKQKDVFITGLKGFKVN